MSDGVKAPAKTVRELQEAAYLRSLAESVAEAMAVEDVGAWYALASEDAERYRRLAAAAVDDLRDDLLRSFKALR